VARNLEQATKPNNANTAGFQGGCVADTNVLSGLPGLGAALLVVAFCQDLPVDGYRLSWCHPHNRHIFSAHRPFIHIGIDAMKVSAFVVLLMHYAAAQTLCLPNCPNGKCIFEVTVRRTAGQLGTKVDPQSESSTYKYGKAR
jgi:hypothetical protein